MPWALLSQMAPPQSDWFSTHELHCASAGHSIQQDFLWLCKICVMTQQRLELLGWLELGSKVQCRAALHRQHFRNVTVVFSKEAGVVLGCSH
jgi:hypothetical protein